MDLEFIQMWTWKKWFPCSIVYLFNGRLLWTNVIQHILFWVIARHEKYGIYETPCIIGTQGILGISCFPANSIIIVFIVSIVLKGAGCVLLAPLLNLNKYSITSAAEM